MSQPKGRRDSPTLAVAALLLLAAALGGWLWNERARDRRDAVLAGVPDFPAPGQVAHARPLTARVPRPVSAPAALPRPDAGPRPERPPSRDRLNAFALAPAKSVMVVQVNALLNTPVFARLKECMPAQFRQLEEAGRSLGVDLERDIDRVAVVPGGMAISGFFGDKPLAESLARARGGGEPQQRSYRDQTMWIPQSACLVQMGTTMLAGPEGGCEGLVDRALDGPATADSAQELYGYFYARTDLTSARGELSSGEQDAFGTLLQNLNGLTVRANVWDQVALSLDGDPAAGGKSDELARMAQGAIALAKTQIGDDDVELQALAQLAKVKSEDGKLKVDLALPADDLFDKLHLPCPGRARDGGQ